MFRIVAFSFLLTIFSALPVWSFTIPPVPTDYVNDYAKILDSQAKGQLEENLENFDRKTGNQIVIAIFRDLQGASIEEFSIRLAEKWKPGKQGIDNGVLIVLAEKERAIRIEVGYGLEPLLPDALSKRIIDQVMVPYFQKGDFDQGLFKGVVAIQKTISGDERYSDSKHNREILNSAFWILFIFIFFILKRGRPFGGVSLGGRFRGGGFRGGGGSFGGGGASGRW